MDFNYKIVLFKNREKKKIINKFKTYKKAKKFYDKLISESEQVIFPINYENGKKCNFELALIEKKTENFTPIILRDEIGRQIEATLDDNEFVITKIQTYYIEEEIVEYSTKNKISSPKIITKYLNGDGLKLISKLNNKIVIQIDDDVQLFTFKNVHDSDRFIDVISEHFIKMKRADSIFVKDYNTSQRKYLYDFLVGKGFSKTYLQRCSTTHLSKR